MKTKNKLIIISSIVGALLIVFLCVYLIFILPEKKKEKELLAQVEQYYATKLETYELENEQVDDYEVDVAFVGDSLTDGYNLDAYFPDIVTSNRGIGGETTIGLEKRLKVSIYDLKPKVVVMLIGGNNLKTMFDNYEKIVKCIKENLPETEVVLLSLTAMGKDWKHKNEIAALNNVKIKMIADKYDCFYVDLFTPLYDLSTNELYADYTVDGAHFTQKGYEVVTETIRPTILLALEKYSKK